MAQVFRPWEHGRLTRCRSDVGRALPLGCRRTVPALLVAGPRLAAADTKGQQYDQWGRQRPEAERPTKLRVAQRQWRQPSNTTPHASQVAAPSRIGSGTAGTVRLRVIVAAGRRSAWNAATAAGLRWRRGFVRARRVPAARRAVLFEEACWRMGRLR